MKKAFLYGLGLGLVASVWLPAVAETPPVARYHASSCRVLTDEDDDETSFEIGGAYDEVPDSASTYQIHCPLYTDDDRNFGEEISEVQFYMGSTSIVGYDAKICVTLSGTVGATCGQPIAWTTSLYQATDPFELAAVLLNPDEAAYIWIEIPSTNLNFRGYKAVW